MIELRYREEGRDVVVEADAFTVSPWHDDLQVIAYRKDAPPLLVARLDRHACWRSSDDRPLTDARFFSPPPPGQWRGDLLAGFFGEDYAAARTDRGFAFSVGEDGIHLRYLASDDVQPETYSTVVFQDGCWSSRRFSAEEKLTIYGLSWADASLSPRACPLPPLGARSRVSPLAARSPRVGSAA